MKTMLFNFLLFLFFSCHLNAQNDESLWVSLTGEGRTESELMDKPAPDFCFRTITGDYIRLSDLEDHVVMLVMTKTICKPCWLEMPVINRLAEKYQDEKFVIIALYGQGTSKGILKTQKFLEEKGKVGRYHEYVAIVPTSYLGNAADGYNDIEARHEDYESVVGPFLQENYKVNSAPSNFLIDRDGTVRDFSSGFQSDREEEFFDIYSHYIDRLLKN
ncbi:MAG: TlpA disulfide reductase family protein [Bacteroidota bacterium]